MCLAVIRTHDVPFSSELPQNFRGKASPPGKLAAQQTDRAGMEPPGPFMGIFREIIDSSNRFALSPLRGVPEGEPACLPVEAIRAKLLRQLVTYVPCRK